MIIYEKARELAELINESDEGIALRVAQQAEGADTEKYERALNTLLARTLEIISSGVTGEFGTANSGCAGCSGCKHKGKT